jgi:hypothetical protein
MQDQRRCDDGSREESDVGAPAKESSWPLEGGTSKDQEPLLKPPKEMQP